MNQFDTKRILLVLLPFGLFLGGCAGPATPFGAIQFWKSSHFIKSIRTTNKDIDVSFEPGSQRFHKLNNFRITLKDHRGITDEAKIYVYYGDREVSDGFDITIDKEKEILVANFKNLRLDPKKLHDISIHYRANENDNGIVKRWQMPSCDLTKPEAVISTADFKVDPVLLASLEKSALDAELNPVALTALVAQESSFNNKTVSSALAIGMTQMTHLAEEEIVDKIQEWPRYPGIRELSFLELKYHVLTDNITPENEWRLDPKKSFVGGSFYIKHLLKYWGYQSKRKLIADYNLNLTNVILASYNIGPTAVTRAIENKGADWMKDLEGSKSVKYVNMVNSYCTGFKEVAKL